MTTILTAGILPDESDQTAGELRIPFLLTKDLHLALRPKEAAAAIGVCERVLWEMTKADEVPHVRIGKTGKSVIYPVDELRAWLSRKAAEPQPKRERPEKTPEGS